MVQKLDDETITKIKEMYEKTSSVSETAKALNLSKGVVSKYLNEQLSSREVNVPPPTTQRTEVLTKTVHVNIQDVICEQTLMRLHNLTVREGYECMDEFVKELIDLYMVFKEGYRQSISLKQDKERYIPASWLDCSFGYSLASICDSAIVSVASLLDKSTRKAIDIAKTVIEDMTAKEEFIDSYSKRLRQWYDRTLLNTVPQELINELVQSIVKNAYPKAKALAARYRLS
jgi:predicted transcriptional regulator